MVPEERRRRPRACAVAPRGAAIARNPSRSTTTAGAFTLAPGEGSYPGTFTTQLYQEPATRQLTFVYAVHDVGSGNVMSNALAAQRGTFAAASSAGFARGCFRAPASGSRRLRRTSRR